MEKYRVFQEDNENYIHAFIRQRGRKATFFGYRINNSMVAIDRRPIQFSIDVIDIDFMFEVPAYDIYFKNGSGMPNVDMYVLLSMKSGKKFLTNATFENIHKVINNIEFLNMNLVSSN